MTNTFTTPNGSYGAEPVSFPGFQEMVAAQAADIRSGGGGAGDRPFPILLLATIGAKTGVSHETPVAYWPQQDGSWVIVGSKSGQAKHPAWYWNLAANPDGAAIVVAGEEIPVHAEELHDEARETVWAGIAASSEQFANYVALTDRTLPVVRLTRR